MNIRAATKRIFEIVCQEFPEFSIYNVRDDSLIRGRDFAMVKAHRGFFWFIVLVRHTGLEQVTAEYGWSRSGRFPVVSPRPCTNSPEIGIDYPEFVLRLKDSKNRDRWWRVSSDSDDERLNKIAFEITQEIRDNALAILGKFAADVEHEI